MNGTKARRIARACNTSKYPYTYTTVMNMIPEAIQKKLPWYQLAEIVDIIQRSYENGYRKAMNELVD